ncbi:hypothetical protein [Okeania sp.]|nr:hypothetical protein [Okeania sp.]
MTFASSQEIYFLTWRIDKPCQGDNTTRQGLKSLANSLSHLKDD